MLKRDVDRQLAEYLRKFSPQEALGMYLVSLSRTLANVEIRSKPYRVQGETRVHPPLTEKQQKEESLQLWKLFLVAVQSIPSYFDVDGLDFGTRIVTWKDLLPEGTREPRRVLSKGELEESVHAFKNQIGNDTSFPIRQAIISLDNFEPQLDDLLRMNKGH